MSRYSQFDIDNQESDILKSQILRYISFWPYLILLILFFFISAFLYLRYTVVTYETSSVIEILDESQNSEMALPTELTVFNRSMINLENEINRLQSYQLNSNVVKKINANVLYFTKGLIKASQVSSSTWFDEYTLEFNIDTDEIDKISSFSISTDNNKLEISSFDEHGDFVSLIKFNSLSTIDKNHTLPFDLTIIKDDNPLVVREIFFNTVESQTNNFRSALNVSTLGTDSDQLMLRLTHRNKDISQQYLDELIKSFDLDGISDRQLEYSRTIDFVNNREKILKEDLNFIESKKQDYKQKNNIFDINIDATNSIGLKSTYNSEIFQLESQNQIVKYLIESISELNFEFLPINIGLENNDLNNMINEYNKIVLERFQYKNQAGSNNFLVKSLEDQLNNIAQNISSSLKSFSNSIDLKLRNLKVKENEFDSEYNMVPENEKTLRSIERELSIKEALYLLLLQKREEASINLAVVKPTIKVIDYSITDLRSKFPNPFLVYISSFISAIFLYFIILFIWFFLDNKVHTKDQLVKLLNNEIPIIAEIPFINDINFKYDVQSKSRSLVSESIRMLLSNLRFTTIKSDLEKSNVIIFTSSIKGEGKTIASVNTAIGLANDLKSDKKVILLGSDLRNPQVHKSFGVEKSQKGITELIYNSDHKNYKSYVNSFQNLDVLFSGSIPPNPTALLSSDEFKNLILNLKTDYDYIIIDSAPCLLVSDTLQYIDFADSVVYLFRANFTDAKIVNFINESFKTNKIKNLNIVLNAIGNSASYGYKYQYQYGYKYSYNYGYGYGYLADE